MSLDIVIVEDEPPAARMLKKMLERAQGLKIGALSICSSIGEAKELLESRTPDLLFLDINVRGESGFDVVDDFLASPFETIITTADTAHAVRAFEIGALDYLVKPFSQQRLETALGKLLSREGGKPVRRILVKDTHGVTPVEVESIKMVNSAGDYSEIVLMDGARKLSAKRMDFFERTLPAQFMRIHRSAIVRLSMVEEVVLAGGSKYHARIKGEKDPAPVARASCKKLMESLEG